MPIIGITVLIATIGVVATVVTQSNIFAYANRDSPPSPSSIYDCSTGSDGCNGIVYCDISDKGSCYDRFEGDDDGGSTDPLSSSFKGIANPEPPYYK
ncbi:MAG: hypothetical protein M3162_04320 [Thermoproteota archaeon]|nr:hypothetical protein [Thermoproteota archaeon]